MSEGHDLMRSRKALLKIWCGSIVDGESHNRIEEFFDRVTGTTLVILVPDSIVLAEACSGEGFPGVVVEFAGGGEGAVWADSSLEIAHGCD